MVPSLSSLLNLISTIHWLQNGRYSVRREALWIIYYKHSKSEKSEVGLNLYEVYGSHCSENVIVSLLGCKAVWTCR
jgi:hypothetical protein